MGHVRRVRYPHLYGQSHGVRNSVSYLLRRLYRFFK